MFSVALSDIQPNCVQVMTESLNHPSPLEHSSVSWQIRALQN